MHKFKERTCSKTFDEYLIYLISIVLKFSRQFAYISNIGGYVGMRTN